MDVERESQGRLEQSLKRGITRRRAIKVAGIAALGLTFSKPAIETFYPKPAFANYVSIDDSGGGSTPGAGGPGGGQYPGYDQDGNPDRILDIVLLRICYLLAIHFG